MVDVWVRAALWLTACAEPAAEDIVLSWDAPPQCPAKTDVIARVRARCGERHTARVEAEAVIERSPSDPDAWRLRLWVKGDETVATREVEADSCDALADTAATMLAVAATAEPPAEAASVEIPVPVAPVHTSDERAATPIVAPPSRPMSAPSSARTVRARERRRARLAALAGVDHGAVPGTGGTIAAELGVHWPQVRLSAFAVHAFGRRVSARDGAARHRLSGAGVSLCVVAPLSAFELGGCASAELGALASEGTRGRALRARRSLWAAGSLGGTASWRFTPRWSLVLRVDAVVPGLRHGFYVGDERVGRIGPVGVRALGGLAVVLP